MKNNGKSNFVGQRKNTLRDFNFFEMGFRKEFKKTGTWLGWGVGRHGGKFGSESVLQGHGERQVSKGDMYRFPIVEEQLGLCISFLWLL